MIHPMANGINMPSVRRDHLVQAKNTTAIAMPVSNTRVAAVTL